jgi:glutathione S-transferase
MAIEFYQLPISHYCEKVRFALDYKGLDYKVRNILPARHRLTTTKVGRGTSVPVISHKGNGVQGSEKIISYLDENFPERPLTPADPDRRAEAIAWERWLDAEVGTDVRLLSYHAILQHPEVVKDFFTIGVPWWSRLYLKFSYEGLVKKLCEHMDITATNPEAALIRVQASVERLANEYAQRDYLVGGVFTRADLSAAALLAPLYRPEKFPVTWPDVSIEPLDTAREKMAERLAWGHRIYRDFR